MENIANKDISITPPSPPAPPTSVIMPPVDINDFNGYSDYYRDVWGLDSIPVATNEKNKEDEEKTVIWKWKWKLYKENPMPQEKI